MKVIYYSEFKSNPIESMILGSYQDRLVYIGINEKNLDTFAGQVNLIIKKDQNANKATIDELREYFAGKRKNFTVETEFLIGTDFQKKVWHELANIQYGEIISYKELAERVGSPKAYRAVGNSNAKNPIPIIFPCHRVVASGGGLGGYSLGSPDCSLGIKKYLLDMESGNLAKV